ICAYRCCGRSRATGWSFLEYAEIWVKPWKVPHREGTICQIQMCACPSRTRYQPIYPDSCCFVFTVPWHCFLRSLAGNDWRPSNAPEIACVYFQTGHRTALVVIRPPSPPLLLSQLDIFRDARRRTFDRERFQRTAL